MGNLLFGRSKSAKHFNEDTDNEEGDSQESDTAVEGPEDDEDLKNEITQISESVFVYQNRKISDHGNVFEGEVRSGVYGVRVCAIKIDRKSEQIVREARILSKINSHTHVISLIESGIYKNMFEERVYIALDKCHEHNLDQHIKFQNESGVKFNLSEALEYSKQIIAAVTFVHENFIIHKDLKPANILLSLDRRTIKLADFGLSQEIKSTSSKVYSKHQFGTNGYRPIESFGDNWVSLKSDIFSLGVVLYFVLSNGKSPFGSENSLWTYNIENGVIDLSHWLVSNAKMFQHLIKLMLSRERCRRPSIWQVADHPCWTGKKHKCKFDYGFTEETDDSDVKILPQGNQDSRGDSESEMESRRQMFRALEKMGHYIPPARKPSIIIFDWNLKHLQRFNPRNKTVSQMHEFNAITKRSSSEAEQIDSTHFSSVSIGDHIYVLMKNQSMYRLKYCDVTATWERMADLIEDHGRYSSAVVVSGSIIIAGGSFPTYTKSVTKYDPSRNRWKKLKDKQLKTRDSANVSSGGFVYCCGGLINGIGVTDKVERLNVVSQSWDEVASMRKARYWASAVECRGNLFVAGGTDRDLEKAFNSVEKYDPDVNQWTIVKPMTEKRLVFRCYLIDGNIYAVGPDAVSRRGKGIEKYDFQKNEWEDVEFPQARSLRIYDSVLVKM